MTMLMITHTPHPPRHTSRLLRAAAAVEKRETHAPNGLLKFAAAAIRFDSVQLTKQRKNKQSKQAKGCVGGTRTRTMDGCCSCGRRRWRRRRRPRSSTSSLLLGGTITLLLQLLHQLQPAAAAAPLGLGFARPPPPPPKKWVDVTPGAVPRLDARDFIVGQQRQAFEAVALESPLVLTHAFDDDGSGGGALRRFSTDEAFSDCFFDTFADARCSYQRKGNARGARPRLYEGPLAEVVGGMMGQSHHGDAWYMLSEDLLDTAGGGAAAAALRTPLTLPPALFGALDYFDLFPPSVRPKKSCVILGGPGARSFLHADPYEWLGVNYLFEGRKLWTFLRPTPANEQSLGLQRVKPDAWDAAAGAGWKSDGVDLYHVEPRVEAGAEGHARVTMGLPPTLAKALPPGDVLGCVQEEGDLVVIPPRWSHQVYHLTPALALAWQLCNRSTLRRVLGHVLEYCQEEASGGGGGGGEGVNVPALLAGVWDAPPSEGGEEGELAWAQSRIEAALHIAMELRYGKENAPREWARLKEQQQ